jgi:hypothetical protein
MPDLVRMIGEPTRSVQLRQATVTATSTAGTATIRFGTGGGEIAGVRVLGSASFGANTAVWVLQQGYDMLIIGQVKAATASAALPQTVYEGLEIYHPTLPMIDFHRAANPAGDSNADYNVRLVNNAVDTLSMHTAAAGRWGIFRVGTTPNACIGAYGWDSNWAHFGCWEDFATSAGYAFLSHRDGDTIVNARANVYIRRNGVTNDNELRLDASGLYVSDDIAIPSDRALYFKGPWDASHMIHHSAADDGFRYITWNYHRFYLTGAERARFQAADGLYMFSGWVRTYADRGYYFEDRGCGWHSGAWLIIHNYGEGKLRHHKNVWMNSGNWGSMPESESAGNQDVGYAWHMPGWRAIGMWLGTDNIVRIQQDTGGWPRVDCDVNDVSGADTKRDMEDIAESVLGKMKQLKPIRFKRKPDQKMREKWLQEVAEGRWAPEQVEIVRRMDEEVHAGFTAENMAAVFPEVATLNPATGEYDGIRYRELVAPLVRAVQELTDRLEALEKGVKK